VAILQAAVLGVVQGLTEFLPVSSDGHLAITYRLFGQSPDLSFEIFLHSATLLALVVYFWRDILDVARASLPAGKGSPERRLGWLIVLATAISGVLALALKKAVEAANESLVAIGVGFLVTAAALLAAELIARRVAERDVPDLGWQRTAAIAIAQALAVLPGVSRSGSTIAAGMLSGLSREKAARFSFLLGIPIIAAANLYEAKDVVSGAIPLPALAPSLAGFVAAAGVGYLAIRGLLALVRTRPLYAFSVYTAVVGLAVIAWGVAG
jgi:undecaprenyl-diphosphatase